MHKMKIAAWLVVLATYLAGPSMARADEKTYENAIHSVAWIISPMQQDQWDGVCSVGTAVIERLDYRLLVTAYHVVGDRDQVMVFFPEFDAQGQAIAETSYYIQNRSTLGIEGKVIWRDATKDLALITVPRMPAGALAIKSAAEPPRIGQTVSAIGNSGFQKNVLWRLSNGIVRQVLHDYSFPLVTDANSTGTPQNVHAAMLETQLAINEGDSGGPALNDAGELVGICSSMDPHETLISYVISADEVGAAVGAYDVNEYMKQPHTPLGLNTPNWLDGPAIKDLKQNVLNGPTLQQRMDEERTRDQRIITGVIIAIIVLTYLFKK